MSTFCKLFFVMVASLAIIACKSKTGNETIVGKWNFQDLEYATTHKTYHQLGTEEKDSLKKKDMEEMKGMTFVFNEDQTYQVIPPEGENIEGKYTVNTGTGEITFTRSGSENKELGKFNLKGNNLGIEDVRLGIIIQMKRKND